MRKGLIITGLVILVLVIAMIFVPIIFRPQIINMVKSQANKNLNALLDFDDLNLNLLSHFPSVTLTIDKLTIINREPFSGDTLASIDKFQATMNAASLILKRRADISSILIKNPAILLKTSRTGQVNWNIVPPSKERAPQAPSDTASAMNLAIKRYKIENARVAYVNDSTNIFLVAGGLNHEGNGDFTKQVFTLSTRTQIEDLNLQMQNINYLKEAKLDVKADLAMDMASKKFEFKENQVKLNELTLAFNGWVAMPDSSIQIDMTFNTPKTDFKDILSMIPAIYKRDFGDLKAEGSLELQGKIQGVYAKDQFPSFNLILGVNNGMFKYSKLPTPVRDVSVDLRVDNPGKSLDATQIDLRRFHLQIANEPFDAQMLIRTPISDPYIDGYCKGNLDLGQVQNFMPLEKDVILEGQVHADFRFRGNMSAVQKQQAERISADGNVSVANVKYSAPTLPVPVNVNKASVTFSPQKATLDNFELVMDKSDMRANGGLNNIFGYVFGNQTLTGNLTTQSEYFDLNPWMSQEGGALQPIELPGRINFLLDSHFNKVVITNMNLSNVRGRLILKDKILTLVDLNADFLEGSLLSNGTYSYIPPEMPHIDFNLKASNFSIPEMFKTFVTVQRLAPMAGYMSGKFSGNIHLTSDLGDSLMPLWQTITSQGAMDIMQAKFENFEPLNRLADAVKLNELKNPSLSNFASSYQINDGTFFLKPTALNLAGYQVVASGSNSIDKSINYLLKLNIPAAQIKSGVNSAISGIINQDVSMLTDETVELNANIGGTITDPKVEISLGQIVKGAGQQLREAAIKEAEQKQQELEQQAKQKVEQEKAAQEEQLKKQAEEQKKKAEENIKDKIKGIFK